MSLGAMAQEAPITAAQTPEMQEVVVTGTLLARPDAETAEAVSIITTDSLKAQGITTDEQALQQISANQSASYQSVSAVSTYTGGGSFADLRSLGASRTLVLLDGQRLANNVTLGYAVDLTGIPFAAIDHVEVLREGASSLYGTDAMAGVINFITKKDYDKGEVNVTLSRPQDSGGSSGDADFTFGKGNLASDGYNFMVAANYTKGDELTAQQRSFSRTGYYPSQGLINVNDPGNVPGSYFDNNSNQWQVGYPACTGNPYLARYPAGNCGYLYSAAVDLIPKSDEVSGLASVTKSLPWNNTLSLQYFWTQAKSTTWGGPSEYGFEMDPGSPYFPTAANSTCVGSCSGAVDLTDPITAIWTDPNDNRYTKNTNTEQRVLLTFAGKNAGWDYAASVDYSKNTNAFAVTGELSTQCANGLSTPTCGYVAQTPQNTGGISTDGFDINASYLIRSDFGKFRVGMDATAVTQFRLQEYENGPELNLVGQFNQGNQPVIRWQYLATVDWSSNSGVWGAGLQDRFLSRYADEFSNVAGVTTNPREVGTYSVWNGYASVKPIDSLTVLFGIRNLFNTNPPFSNQTANWQTPYNPLFSDPLGRTFYMNLKYQF